jgi:hypothetical protein
MVWIDHRQAFSGPERLDSDKHAVSQQEAGQTRANYIAAEAAVDARFDISCARSSLGCGPPLHFVPV